MNKRPFDGLEWIEAGAPDTEEVTSSNLVAPTKNTRSEAMFSGLFYFSHQGGSRFAPSVRQICALSCTKTRIGKR